MDTQANRDPFFKSHLNVQDLDKFLKSAVGERLFPNLKPEKLSQQQTNSKLFTEGFIRPSPQFLSVPRQISPGNNFIKEKNHVETITKNSEKRNASAPRPNMASVANQIEALQQKRDKLAYEQTQLHNAKARRILYLQERSVSNKLQELKMTKMQESKLARIVKFGYPGGILGGDNPDEVGNTQSLYWKVYQNNQRKQRQSSENKSKRNECNFYTDLYSKRCTNSDIEFSNINKSTSSTENIRCKKQVKEPSNTFSNIFEQSTSRKSPQRQERLQSLERGGKDFNIISNAYHKF